MATCSVTPADDYFNINGHALVDGDRIYFTWMAASLGGFTIGQWYYVCSANARTQNDKFKIELTVGGGALPITGTNGDAIYTTMYNEPEYVIAQPWNDPLDPEREDESSGNTTPPVSNAGGNFPFVS